MGLVFEFVVSARRLNVQTPFGSDGRGRCQQLASETPPKHPFRTLPQAGVVNADNSPLSPGASYNRQSSCIRYSCTE
jgi:hypothetical protein